MRVNTRRNKRKITNNKNDNKLINKKLIILIIAIFLILLLSTIFALINSMNEKIVSRVIVNNQNISNLTIDEAYEKLNSNLKDKKNKDIIVKHNEYETSISLEQLEVDYNVLEAISEAYKIGRNSNIIINNYEIILSKIFEKNIEKDININENELDKVIDDISAKIPDILEESSYYIEKDNLIISKGKAGIVVKKEEFKNIIVESIKKQIKGKELEEIEIPVEEKEPEQIDIEKIKKEIYKEPQDAYYEENTSKFYKEVNGIDFNISIDDAKKIIKEEKEEYTIPLKITKPKITIQNLSAKKDLFPEKLSKFITRYDESNVNRSTNIKLATEKINGIVLMPGEIFSYNKTVGARTIKAGYKEASVYMNGKVVDGIGGGICQVSSTLYNAVLQANLGIVERKNHHFITSYVSASRDATVSYGTIDFKFKNTRTYPIKIESTSQNGICKIEIKGIKEDIEYEIEIQDEITEVIPYKTKYIESNELEKGIEEEIQKGVDGCRSEAYRILKQNGQVISKTLLSKDSYNPLERIIKKGTK